jgi:ribosomal protein L11 methyltransferase
MEFRELTVPTSEETSEGLTNFRWEQGALGVVEEARPGVPARLRAFFADTTSSSRLLTGLRNYLAGLSALGLPVADGDPRIVPLREEAWATAWQRSFPPREVGARLLVLPPWEAADGVGTSRGARAPVIIEPGRAFGTGQHGSTEGCLALLEAALGSEPVYRALDIGTGTGILAVAAVKLGAGRVLAIDVDPDAIAASRANAERNRCAARIDLALVGPESLSGDPAFPLILANLLGHTHLALAGQYRRLATPDGALILGGMLADDEVPVITAIEREGFVPTARHLADGWVSLLLRRRA